MGRKEVGRGALQWLLNRDDVEVVGVMTDNHLEYSPTGELAADRSLPLYTFEAALRLLEQGKLDHDLSLSMLYWRKLKKEFLSTPSLGAINFHPAPLPDYKGTAGYNLAILNRMDEWAATAHYMDEGDRYRRDYQGFLVSNR